MRSRVVFDSPGFLQTLGEACLLPDRTPHSPRDPFILSRGAGSPAREPHARVSPRPGHIASLGGHPGFWEIWRPSLKLTHRGDREGPKGTRPAGCGDRASSSPQTPFLCLQTLQRQARTSSRQQPAVFRCLHRPHHGAGWEGHMDPGPLRGGPAAAPRNLGFPNTHVRARARRPIRAPGAIGEGASAALHSFIRPRRAFEVPFAPSPPSRDSRGVLPRGPLRHQPPLPPPTPATASSPPARTVRHLRRHRPRTQPPGGLRSRLPDRPGMPLPLPPPRGSAGDAQPGRAQWGTQEMG